MADNKALVINLITPPFRMAFPALFEPTAIKGSAPKYKVTALFPPDADLRELKKALYDVMEDRFGRQGDWPKGRNDVHPQDKLYKADEKAYQGFNPGWLACTFSTTNQPGVVDANKQEVLNPRQAYGGRWARAAVAVTTYNNKEFGTKGVSVYLNHVQLLEDDEPFDGRSSAKNVFDAYQLKDPADEETVLSLRGNDVDGYDGYEVNTRPSSRSANGANHDRAQQPDRRASADRASTEVQARPSRQALPTRDPDMEREAGRRDRSGDDDDWN